ncbi:hypothetical protein A3J03_05440 [Candidatus Uhrbacteria bacterium RIFCSPLOWO2_02_FULL_46_25]|nr:MAG: hypothetical protein A3J03_05440 [Candidatus Uhrbacteria bacterium RIFCSPLOWO2_02_FULL_46_25]
MAALALSACSKGSTPHGDVVREWTNVDGSAIAFIIGAIALVVLAVGLIRVALCRAGNERLALGNVAAATVAAATVQQAEEKKTEDTRLSRVVLDAAAALQGETPEERRLRDAVTELAVARGEFRLDGGAVAGSIERCSPYVYGPRTLGGSLLQPTPAPDPKPATVPVAPKPPVPAATVVVPSATPPRPAPQPSPAPTPAVPLQEQMASDRQFGLIRIILTRDLGQTEAQAVQRMEHELGHDSHKVTAQQASDMITRLREEVRKLRAQQPATPAPAAPKATAPTPTLPAAPAPTPATVKGKGKKGGGAAPATALAPAAPVATPPAAPAPALTPAPAPAASGTPTP